MSIQIAESMSVQLGQHVTPMVVNSMLVQGVLTGIVLTIDHGRYAEHALGGAHSNPAYQSIADAAEHIAAMLPQRNLLPAELAGGSPITGDGMCEVCHENRVAQEPAIGEPYACARCARERHGGS